MSANYEQYVSAPEGLSSTAIAFLGAEPHYPHDPSDLLRCMRFCVGRYTTEELRVRMAGRSVQWDRLLAEWDNLTALLRHEIDTHTDGRAPLTYQEMKRVIAGGISCPTCEGTGRGELCLKCKGSGKRGGGRCRAPRCYRGAGACVLCRGAGYNLPRPLAERGIPLPVVPVETEK